MEPNVWFVTPAYRRYALADVCFEQRADMIAKLPFEAHAVVIADDDNLSAAEKHGLHVVEMDNQFVGRKFNAGFQHAIERGATHVMAVGSDSFLHPSAFDGTDWDSRDATGIIGLSSFSPYGDERIDLGIKYAAGFGVGMVYPSWCLPREPCAERAQYGCDNSTWGRCGRGKMKVRFLDHRLYVYCNFHSDDEQITDFSSLSRAFHRMLGHETDIDKATAVLDGMYPAHLVERLRSIYAARSVGAFLTARKGVPRSTKPPRRNARPTDKRIVMGDRAARIQKDREERRARARARVIMHMDEAAKFQRGEPAVDVAGVPVPTGTEYRIAHRRKTP